MNIRYVSFAPNCHFSNEIIEYSIRERAQPLPLPTVPSIGILNALGKEKARELYYTNDDYELLLFFEPESIDFEIDFTKPFAYELAVQTNYEITEFVPFVQFIRYMLFKNNSCEICWLKVLRTDEYETIDWLFENVSIIPEEVPDFKTLSSVRFRALAKCDPLSLRYFASRNRMETNDYELADFIIENNLPPPLALPLKCDLKMFEYFPSSCHEQDEELVKDDYHVPIIKAHPGLFKKPKYLQLAIEHKADQIKKILFNEILPFKDSLPVIQKSRRCFEDLKFAFIARPHAFCREICRFDEPGFLPAAAGFVPKASHCLNSPRTVRAFFNKFDKQARKRLACTRKLEILELLSDDDIASADVDSLFFDAIIADNYDIALHLLQRFSNIGIRIVDSPNCIYERKPDLLVELINNHGYSLDSAQILDFLDILPKLKDTKGLAKFALASKRYEAFDLLDSYQDQDQEEDYHLVRCYGQKPKVNKDLIYAEVLFQKDKKGIKNAIFGQLLDPDSQDLILGYCISNFYDFAVVNGLRLQGAPQNLDFECASDPEIVALWK